MSDRLSGNVDLSGLTGDGEFRMMLAVDTANYSGHWDQEQITLVTRMHQVMREAFRDSGLDWDACMRLDEGDGLAVIFPRDFHRYTTVIDPLLHNLNGKLREYNRQAARDMRLRPRVAVHMGPIVAAEESLVGNHINLLFRLLDRGPVKEALALAGDAHIAVAVSEHVYEDLVQPERGSIDRRDYHEIPVELRHVGRRRAWIAVPGSGIAARDAGFWQAVAAAGAADHGQQKRQVLAGASAALTKLFRGIATSLRTGATWLRDRRPRARPGKRWWIGGAVIVVVAAVVGVWFAVIRPRVGPCSAPLELNVLTSPDSLQPVSDAARAFESQDRSYGCPRVDMTVYAVPDGEARQALNDGWRNSNGLPLGPPPNIWMPDTTADRGMLDASLIATSGLSLTPIGITRTSPYVVGVPTADAQRLGTEQLTDWPSFYRALLQAKLKLARPSTATSTTALAQTDGIWSDLRHMPDAPTLGELEHELNGSNLTGTDEADLLCELRNHPAPHTAVLVTERALAAYNTGAALNDRCPATDPLDDNERLIPYVPTTRRVADYPMYEVTYRGIDSTEQSEVKAFHQWLVGDSSPMAAAGYRGPDRVARGMLTGSDAGRIMTSLGPMDPVTGLARFSTALTDQRGDVRLLVALDVSGSLNDRATTEGTPYDLSLNAVRTAKGAIMSHDRIALWRFPGGSDSGHDELAGFGSTSEPNAGVRKISDVLSDPPSPTARKTPLFRTIIDGVNALTHEAGPHTRLGLLVISDGKDEPSRRDKVSAADVRRVLGDAGRDVHIAVVNPVRGGCVGSGVDAIGVTCMSLVGDEAVSTFLAGLWGG